MMQSADVGGVLLFSGRRVSGGSVGRVVNAVETGRAGLTAKLWTRRGWRGRKWQMRARIS